MNPSSPKYELLVRYLDGALTLEEVKQVSDHLRTDAGARALLRELAEQSVMIADLERLGSAERPEFSPRFPWAAEVPSKMVEVGFRQWRWGLAAAVIIILAAVGIQVYAATKGWVIRVSKVSGASQFFGAKGALQNTPDAGLKLRAGDTLETRSCDAWIDLDLRDGSKMTIGGRSTLRVLESETKGMYLNLVNGSLWVSPKPQPGARPLMIQTPTLTIAARQAQFDLQTSATETMVRVNKGSARVRQLLDGSVIELAPGFQVSASLGRNEPLAALPQPEAIDHWTVSLEGAPEVAWGRWLPPNGVERARIGAQPLLWPLPDREPLMLYAAAVSVARSSERPVLLKPGSRLVFGGRTERPERVRFGFSTQKMRGVFSGKFELDVKADLLRQPGETWEVTLPLSDFRSLQPQLSQSPDGLELTDVYALTIDQDAGLELNRIELLPGQPMAQDANR